MLFPFSKDNDEITTLLCERVFGAIGVACCAERAYVALQAVADKLKAYADSERLNLLDAEVLSQSARLEANILEWENDPFNQQISRLFGGVRPMFVTKGHK